MTIAPANRTGTAPRLTRDALARAEGGSVATPPVRIVHLGLGAFHRAHQVWYTAAAADAGEWGFASFTGRSAHQAELLAPQDGLYTLVERSGDGDSATIVTNLVAAIDGADLGRMVELLAAPETAIVTLTITEAGYRLTPDGLPDPEDRIVAEDAEILRDRFAGHGDGRVPGSTLARLLAGLAERQTRGSGPLAIVPCDNMPDNGELVRRGLTALARSVDAGLAAWIEGSVSFVSTSVDRITPRTTEADLESARELTGFADASPVVTEPFRDWVLSGDFPAGRPQWETAGARFVEDIEPFERRKLWLLNGAHSYLAYAGLLAGHETVAAAVADPELLRGMRALWAEAAAHLPAELLRLEEYTHALEERFGNARIEHRLEQIAMEGVAKLRVRIAPVALAELAAGRTAEAAARAFGAWAALTLRGPLPDVQSEALAAIAAEPGEDAVARLVALVEPALAEDEGFLGRVRSAADV